MEGTSTSHFPSGKTELRSISECIRHLTKMRLSIALCGDKVLPSWEFSVIKSDVVSRLELLFKGTEKGGQNPLPTSHLPPSTMKENPSFYFLTAQTVCSTISKCLSELLEMQILMRQMPKIEDTLCQSELQEKIIQIKSSVVSQLEVLFKIKKEALDDGDDEAFVQGNESLRQRIMEGFQWSSLDAMKDTKGRYLCLSNGYEVWCLDLKHSSSNTEPGPLPLISALNLLGGELPTSVGLFNLGSDAYLIGGKKLPASLKEWDLRKARILGNCTRKLEAMYRYRALCYARGTKGSSRFSYCLSLDADKDGVLSPSECNIEPLKNPKFWPIVENIDGKLHVMDSRPFYLRHANDDDFVFSHEVREMGSGSWENIQTGGIVDGIFNHVVIGDRIFAYSMEGYKELYTHEFDSQTGKWKTLPLGKQLSRFFMVKTVGDIMTFGTARCAGEFPVPFPHEGERVFVLFAIVRGDYDPHGSYFATFAVAYLVTLTGRVICYQHVPDFYSREKRLEPCGMIAATVIHVDKDQGTMCSVVSAFLRQDLDKMKDDEEKNKYTGRTEVSMREKKEHLFINTFSVEMLACAAPKVRDLLVKKASEAEDGPIVKLEFVRVAVKDRLVYETDVVTWKDGYERCLGWRACFVTPSHSSCEGVQQSSLESDE